MEKETFEVYLKDRYLGQMKYYGDASARNQKKYRLFQWTLIILSAVAPVLAAINLNGEATNNNISLVIITSMVAILTTGLKTFNYQELWVNYRSTHEKLKPEIYYYNFNIGDYGQKEIDKESLFVSRVEGILDAEHNQWPPAKNMQEYQSKEKEADILISSQIAGGTS